MNLINFNKMNLKNFIKFYKDILFITYLYNNESIVIFDSYCYIKLYSREYEWTL